eukprot:TRINITY_DN17655_c0_g1_i1.p1 TRINITY_DN17655_c0_g1~~TRINITY_DN17655_c0_g1_i1.p1  ORF type:complete len:137 (+),score=19.39 TRINITY_DN17655_c0_g1_i1:4633-5043(+)
MRTGVRRIPKKVQTRMVESFLESHGLTERGNFITVEAGIEPCLHSFPWVLAGRLSGLELIERKLAVYPLQRSSVYVSNYDTVELSQKQVGGASTYTYGREKDPAAEATTSWLGMKLMQKKTLSLHRYRTPTSFWPP